MDEVQRSLDRIETKLDVLISLSQGRLPHQTTEPTPHTPATSDGHSQRMLMKRLTPRQHATMLLLVEGYRNAQIAEILGVGENTIKVHVKALMDKLGASNRSQVAMRAHEMLTHISDKEYMDASGGIPKAWATENAGLSEDPYRHVYR